MGVSFGGKACIDPLALARRCRELDLPTDWVGKPNSFRCPLGGEVGRGWILLPRGSIDELDLDAYHDLTFTVRIAGIQQRVTVKDLILVRADCLTPGLPLDPAAAYLCEIADRRHVFRWRPVNRAYNIRSGTGSGASAYFTASLTSEEEPWTWQEIVTNLWNTVGADVLGETDTLPFTPDGTPEGLIYYGSNAWDALTDVLQRLQCAVRWNPLLNVYSIVRIGAADSQADEALEKFDAYRVWDRETVQSNLGRYTVRVRVHFRKYPVLVGEVPYHTIDKSDPTGRALQIEEDPSAYTNVFDDLWALYDTGGSLTNGTALDARATERAVDFFRRFWEADDKLDRVYGLPISDPGMLPGAKIRSIWWGDVGRGLRTEVIRHAPREPQQFELVEKPLTVGKSGGDSYTPIQTILFAGANVTVFQDPSHTRSGNVLVTVSDGDSLTVLEIGNDTYTSVTMLGFDPATGFDVVENSPGNLSVYLLSASATQTGVVNTTTQTIAGAKYFNTSLRVGSGAPTEVGMVYQHNGDAYLFGTLHLNDSGSSVITFGAVPSAAQKSSIQGDNAKLDLVVVDSGGVTTNLLRVNQTETRNDSIFNAIGGYKTVEGGVDKIGRTASITYKDGDGNNAFLEFCKGILVGGGGSEGEGDATLTTGAADPPVANLTLGLIAPTITTADNTVGGYSPGLLGLTLGLLAPTITTEDGEECGGAVELTTSCGTSATVTLCDSPYLFIIEDGGDYLGRILGLDSGTTYTMHWQASGTGSFYAAIYSMSGDCSGFSLVDESNGNIESGNIVGCLQFTGASNYMFKFHDDSSIPPRSVAWTIEEGDTCDE